MQFVNAYVQVGRAIAWIDPRYNGNAFDPLFGVENAITASTSALEAVFRS